MALLVDAVAEETSRSRWVIPDSLRIPVAAANEDAIRDYIGDIEAVLSGGSPKRAFLVTVPERQPIDPLYPISEHPNVAILHARRQVWVHIAFTRYRRAYQRAFPADDISHQVLSHAMNRRIAALKGFQYVRLTPVSPGGNSSSSFSEQWGVALHGTPRVQEIRKIRPPYIQYGDLADLMLMLDIKLGGGIMDAVNEGQRLVERRLVIP
jgi:hypothetical protein